MTEPVRCVHSDKKYSLEFEDGSEVVGLTEQKEWSYSLAKPNEQIYWTMVNDTPDIEGTKNEIKLTKFAMLSWTMYTNLRINYKDSGYTTIHIFWRNSEDDDLFSERPNTLAYAWMPTPFSSKNGIIVMNDSKLWHVDGTPLNHPTIPNAKLKRYDAQHTLTHEIGHSLYLTHESNYNDHVMWPYYNEQRIPQHNDIKRLQVKYEDAKLNRIIRYILERRIRKGVKL